MKWSFIDYDTKRKFKNYDLNKLEIDEFYITFHNNFTSNNTYLYTLHTDCYECPYSLNILLPPRNNNSILPSITTRQYSTNLKFRVVSGYLDTYLPQDHTETVVCDLDEGFGEFGIYTVDINGKGCDFKTLKEPVNIYTSMLTVVFMYLLLYSIIYGIVFVWKKWNYNKEMRNTEDTPEKSRIKSLDTIRGMVIALMVFANYGSGSYRIIKHSIWNGLHVADMAFPCFVWIMGVCIPLSLTSSLKKGLSTRTIFLNILKRCIKLFCWGIFAGSGTGSHFLRIFGVLQRLSVSYLVVATICLFCLKRSRNRRETRKSSAFEDILILNKGWTIAIIILLLHTMIIFQISAPGCPKGYMGPGGLHRNRSFPDCIGGATGYIDGLILGRHLYQNPTIRVYTPAPFEHAGIFGCLTTIVHVFFGVQAGVILAVYKSHSHRVIRWLLWGILCGVSGGGLCGFSKENGIIPVNWNLWSISFVLVTSCFAFVLLSVCYTVVDIRKCWSGKPFLFAGMNSIFLYIGHMLTSDRFPIRWYMSNKTGIACTHFGALITDSWGAGMWILISYYLYKKKYFFTV